MSDARPTDDFPLRTATRDRVRAAARAALGGEPHPTAWRRRAIATLLGAMVVSDVSLLGLLLAGVGHLPRDPSALLVLAALVGAQGIGIWFALAPFSRRRARLALTLLGVSGALVLAHRLATPAHASAVPGWVCAVSHLGFDLLPLFLVGRALRDGAFRPSRALAAGLAAGTLGLLVGELGCARGAAHVLGYHLGTWLVAASALALVLARRPPRTFAP